MAESIAYDKALPLVLNQSKRSLTKYQNNYLNSSISRCFFIIFSKDIIGRIRVGGSPSI